MEAKELLAAVRDRGGEFTVDGVKMQVRPKGVLTDEEREYISAHKPEVLSALTGKPVEDYIEAETFEVKTAPRPKVTPEMWIERIRTHTMAKPAYWQWPERVLTGHGDLRGHKSLLEVIKEMGGNVRLDVANMYAFTISGTRLADNGESELGDFVFDRWAWSEDEYKVGDAQRERRYAGMRKGA